MWDPSAKGMPLGLEAATAPLDGTDYASIPLCGKGGGAHIHTHTPHTESAQHPRARSTHVTHLRLARVPVALCFVSVCE